MSTRAHGTKVVTPDDITSEVVYCYDRSLEGLLSAIFAAYANHEDPTDVVCEQHLQPRLGQRVSFIETDLHHAERVRKGIEARCGWRTFDAVKKASLSERHDAGTAAYRFVRYALDEQKRRDCSRCRKRKSCKGVGGKGPCSKLRGRALSDITHPAVEPMHRILRSIDQECEHMRQFIRFEHLRDAEVDLWYARCNPKSSVIPLVVDHFVERFNVQPFIIYDEEHHLAGVYEGRSWYLVPTEETGSPELRLPDRAADEAPMQQAWKRFYRTVAVESRYNPELRQHFMPKRFWRNLTELQEDLPSLAPRSSHLTGNSGMNDSEHVPPCCQK